MNWRKRHEAEVPIALAFLRNLSTRGGAATINFLPEN
jgi:hypothetical protein